MGIGNSLLNFMQLCLGAADSFYGGDGHSMEATDWRQARVDADVPELTFALPVLYHHGHHDRASATSPLSTSQLGSAQAQLPPQVCQEGHGRIRARIQYASPVDVDQEIAFIFLSISIKLRRRRRKHFEIILLTPALTDLFAAVVADVVAAIKPNWR